VDSRIPWERAGWTARDAGGMLPPALDPSEREAGGAPVRVLSTILVLLVIGVLLAYTLRRRK
jgi:hypothetical protein